MQHDKPMVSGGQSEPDIQSAGSSKPRCHTAPSKSLSAMDLYGDFVPQFGSWQTGPMEGDGREWRSQADTAQTRQWEKTVVPVSCRRELLLHSAASAVVAVDAPPLPSRTEKRPRRPKPKWSADKTDIPNRIFIGGLTPEINEDDLRNVFGPFGELDTVYIKNRGGPTHRGFGFVTFKWRHGAERVVEEAVHGNFSIRGQELQIHSAFMHRKQYDNLQPRQCQPQTVYQQIAPYYMPVPPIIRQNPVPYYSYPSQSSSGVIIPYLTYYDGGQTSSYEDNYGFYPSVDVGFSPSYHRQEQQYSYLDSINAGCSGLDYAAQYSDMPVDEVAECPVCKNRIARPASSAVSTTSDQTYCASCSCCNTSDQADCSTLGDDDREPQALPLDECGAYREEQSQLLHRTPSNSDSLPEHGSTLRPASL